MNKELNRETVKTKKHPEKILQFGTGAFLRGFADYFVDQANKEGNFNGSAVVVSSTGSHRVDSLNQQGGLYTLRIEGFADGSEIEENYIIETISRVLSADSNWKDILDCAHNPEMNIIISNTTEAGLVLEKEDIFADPPQSFPAKLTAFLHERFQWLKKNEEHDPSMIVLPCELVTDNGDKLKKYVLAQASYNDLSSDFVDWINSQVTFCNTLVDRIVTGRPDNEKMDKLQQQLGYTDSMLNIAEPYYFWAIEGPEKLAQHIPFVKKYRGIVIEPDISTYRIRKIRILNGLHIMMVPVGYLGGVKTVEDAINDDVIGSYLREALQNEIIPTLDLPEEELSAFADEVLDRFKNPYLNHQLAAIALTAISKFKVRVLPSILRYVEDHNQLPQRMVFALAALICFYKGEWNGNKTPLNDSDEVISFCKKAWKNEHTREVAETILGNEHFWDQNLNKIPHLTQTVAQYIDEIGQNGIANALPVVDN